MKRAYFVVEGPHDVETVGRFLRLRGMTRVREFDELDEYWKPVVPRSFPHGGHLLRRVPVPVFFASEDASVAVHSAGGHDRIAMIAAATSSTLDGALDGLGVLVDADVVDVQERWSWMTESLSSELAERFPSYDPGPGPGSVGVGEPRSGVYILPDNSSGGALENLLIACAGEAYPTLLAAATTWIRSIDPDDKSIFTNAKERADFGKPFGKEKAIVSCVASVLRPGKAIQVSIQDNLWLREPALDLEIVKQLREFVNAIVDGGVSATSRPEG